MSTLTAVQLLAKLRATAAPIQSAATRTNTKAPISEPDQETIRRHIEQNEPEWLGVFYSLSLETGHRTNDVCAMEWSALDMDAGTCTITVAKQTKAAQARAMAKGLKEIRESRQQAALAAGDAVAYMQWGAATRDQLAAAATPDECNRLQTLVSSAPRKVSTKRLSPALLARLAAMRKAAFWTSDDDNYIFSRALTVSNRTRLQSGHHITRQTVWARLRGVFTACAEQISTAASSLSAYSLRKTAAVALYHASGKSVAVVMRIFGWSSETMALKYLGVEDEAARVQAAMVRGAA